MRPIDEHLEIMAALEAGQNELAADLMLEHIGSSKAATISSPRARFLQRDKDGVTLSEG